MDVKGVVRNAFEGMKFQANSSILRCQTWRFGAGIRPAAGFPAGVLPA
jgi:hypothetical protein